MSTYGTAVAHEAEMYVWVYASASPSSIAPSTAPCRLPSPPSTMMLRTRAIQM
jgi:hypothetical protein